MKLCIFTIVLDGMPWITKHLPVFQQLKCDWEWKVIEGAAMNNGSTRWCKEQKPRLSNDGTTEYLESICDSDQIQHWPCISWDSKDQMVNLALRQISEEMEAFKELNVPAVLMEIDADEIWQPWQLEKIVKMFDRDDGLGAMQFYCDYFVGPNLKTLGMNCYGDMGYEWWRAWRFKPGMRFTSHEPIQIEYEGFPMYKHQTGGKLAFKHYAYATEAQVKFKQQWYGRNGEYDGLLDGWRRLQEVKAFPVRLRDYFPHVKTDLPLVVKADGLG